MRASAITKSSHQAKGFGKSSKSSVFESSYISQLIAEKDQAKLEIQMDASVLSGVGVAMRRGTAAQRRLTETRDEKRTRHMLELEYLMASKNEQMKRHMLDLVDGIHQEEQNQLDDHHSKCKEDMKKFQRNLSEPVNFDVFVIKKLEQLD